MKDRGSDHEEEAEEEARREGEISLCQMVSNKTSASSLSPDYSKQETDTRRLKYTGWGSAVSSASSTRQTKGVSSFYCT